MFAPRLWSASVVVLLGWHCLAGEWLISDDNPLQLPVPGAHQLRVLSPKVLELTLVTTKAPDPAPVQQWNFVDADRRPHLPSPAQFSVLIDGKAAAIAAVGFKRRVCYAPLKKRDLRIGNYLYLALATPVGPNQQVEIRNPDQKLWPADMHFSTVATPLRWSPVIHVNQVGYLPNRPKQAIIGYYLGSLGELDIARDLAGKGIQKTGAQTNSSEAGFDLVDASSGKAVFHGKLVPRRDQGFPFECYEHVFMADFSELRQPGQYRLVMPGLGASFPFAIDEGVAGVFARAYALGLYHQRCGMANALPFTRFTHAACHLAPAEVPEMSGRFDFVNEVLAQETANAKENPRHTAPPLKNIAASLYPFVNRGKVDVHGGHHDAGDYSKYTANSAALIHLLVFAADNFPGAADLDNLGIPESGDGKSDLLEEAKWEADFLARMQDADGGFYFLVYPRERRYEDNVTPDQGDPQVVFPKTTSVTAAAVAALAQCASSPRFRSQFPEAAAAYLAKAKKGWAFLERAIALHGKDGAYQKITHYSDDFMHDDELAWAACEMFLATQNPHLQDRLMEWMDPSDPGTRRWGWWRLFDAYGNAIRSYAFAARSGRVKRDQLQPLYLERCENEIVVAGEDQLHRAEQSAYGTSFPEETKRTRTAGWYFSSDAAFELATACQLDYPALNDPRPRMIEALFSNLNYEAGCNPVNVTYLTGVGWKREREIVDQYAENDRRVLPPSGIPIGNIQDGFGWLDLYGKELGALSFPPDGEPAAPYPMYDRWGDSFNLNTEFVSTDQARALAYLAWLMGQTSLKHQPWRCAEARINGLPLTPSTRQELSVSVSATGLDLSRARIVWEAADQEPAFGNEYRFTPAHRGAQWVEAEAQLPDGRRVFAATNFVAR